MTPFTRSAFKLLESPEPEAILALSAIPCDVFRTLAVLEHIFTASPEFQIPGPQSLCALVLTSGARRLFGFTVIRNGNHTIF